MDAIPIVALLSFMVGMVVAFLGATVLANFGASIFSVHLVAFSFMREFGVLPGHIDCRPYRKRVHRPNRFDEGK